MYGNCPNVAFLPPTIVGEISTFAFENEKIEKNKITVDNFDIFLPQIFD